MKFPENVVQQLQQEGYGIFARWSCLASERISILAGGTRALK